MSELKKIIIMHFYRKLFIILQLLRPKQKYSSPATSIVCLFIDNDFIHKNIITQLAKRNIADCFEFKDKKGVTFPKYPPTNHHIKFGFS